MRGKPYPYIHPWTFVLMLLLSAAVIAFQSSNAANAMPGKRALAPISMDRTFDFIQYDANALRFYGASQRWEHLFAKMDSLVFDGTGQVSMLHIGGSHVQGGFLTDRIRARFEELSSGITGDRGFLFPYKMAGGNMSSSTICSWTGKWKGSRCSLNDDFASWGMAGTEASTTDSIASFTIASRKPDSTLYDFDRLRIYHRHTDNIALVPDSNVQLLSTFTDAAAGYTEFRWMHAVESMRIEVRRTAAGESRFALQGVYMGNGRPGVVYSTIGVNGASTRSYLRCPGFKAQSATIAPDLVIMAIGVNDANVPENQFDMQAYEARYDSLCTMYRAANPNTCFLFITNNDTFYQQRHPNRNALRVREAMQRLAVRYDGGVYDWLEIMGGLGSMRTWRDRGLAAKDLVHFSKSGYELEGDLFYIAFREAFGDYLERKAN